MKKLLSLLSVLTINGTAVPTRIADSSYQKNNIKNLSKLNWKYLTIIRNKRDTNNKNQSVPVFKTNGDDKPTKQQIKEKVLEKNNSLDITKIKVENITENSAEISIIGFVGKKIINFTVDKSVLIKEVITNNNLGILKTNGNNKPSEQQIKDKLKELNPKLNINKIKVTFIRDNYKEAWITSNDPIYFENEIMVNFIVDKSIPLNEIITENQLGKLNYNELKDETIPIFEMEIIYKLKELNPNLDITKVKIKNINNNSVTIYSIDTSVYTYEVTVKYIFPLNIYIKKNNLGEFMTNNLSNPTEQQIKDKLKELVPILDINKIKVENITSNSANISFFDKNSYTENVIVNYTVLVESLNL